MSFCRLPALSRLLFSTSSWPRSLDSSIVRLLVLIEQGEQGRLELGDAVLERLAPRHKVVDLLLLLRDLVPGFLIIEEAGVRRRRRAMAARSGAERG